MKSIIKYATRSIPRETMQKMVPFITPVVSLFLRGNKFEDPITGIRYRKLLPYGRTTSRENALAPDSLSLERHRLMWLYLKERTNFFTEKHKVLHVAPEYCFMNRFRKMKNLDYATADLSSPWADHHFDVHDIPFEENTFDVIFANHIMEHVENDAKVIREFFRVMKPGGFGIFQIPQDRTRKTTLEDPAIQSPEDRLEHYWQEDHVRLYGLDYGDKWKDAGFNVKEDDYIKSIGNGLATKYCLPKGEVIYLCKKPLIKK